MTNIIERLYYLINRHVDSSFVVECSTENVLIELCRTARFFSNRKTTCSNLGFVISKDVNCVNNIND